MTSGEEQNPSRETGRVSSRDSALSLSHSIALGLAQNPDLVAVRQTVNVSSAALGVAQTYPFNPFVQAQATPLQKAPDGNNGAVAHYVVLMQTLQLAHQQQFREEGASALLNSTCWNIHQAELQNVAQTTRLYFNVLYMRGILDLARTSYENNQQLLQILQKQLENGQSTAADVAIMRIDTHSTRQQLRLAQANYETAVRDLKRQLGLTADEPLTIAGDLSSLQWKMPFSDSKMDYSTLKASDLADSSPDSTFIEVRAGSRPDVLAAHSDIDAARANLSLAAASRVPDVQMGPYYQRSNDGITFVGLRVQMDLPVWNSGKPLQQQRNAEYGQRVVIWQQTRRRAEIEAKATWERYRLAFQEVTEDAPQQSDELPVELQQLEREFVAGEVDVVRVVQARTSFIQNRRVTLDLQNELAQSAANLTAASGTPIEEMLASDW